MITEASIYTYIRSKITGSFAQFVAKHGAAVRAPEWSLTRSERAALEPAKSVIAVAPKKGGKKAA